MNLIENWLLILVFICLFQNIANLILFVNDNKQEGSSFLGTYENPFFNISSALSTYQEQSYKENMIIILNSSEFTVSSYFKIEMPLVIKSINFIDDSLKGFMVFTSNGRFEISSSLELNNLVIQIRNPSEMENLFSLEIGASLNLQRISFNFQNNNSFCIPSLIFSSGQNIVNVNDSVWIGLITPIFHTFAFLQNHSNLTILKCSFDKVNLITNSIFFEISESNLDIYDFTIKNTLFSSIVLNQFFRIIDGNVFIEALKIDNMNLTNYTLFKISNTLMTYSYFNLSNSIINSVSSNNDAQAILLETNCKLLHSNITNLMFSNSNIAYGGKLISFVNSIGSYINIFESMFANNSAFPMIYIDNAFNVILKSVQCSSSIKNKILTCFHIKNVEKFLMEYSKIINCFSTYETPGLIVESNWYKIKENAQINISYCLFYANNMQYTNSDYVGAAVFVNSLISIYIRNSEFYENIVDSSKSPSPKGGPCIRTINKQSNLTIYNSTFANNKAFSSSNALEVNNENLLIIFCNFTQNTPLIPKYYASNGGAMYVRTSSIIIKDTYFLKNVNQNGGCIYIEQHEKYSLLYGLIENIVALNNSANEDAGFLFLSRGIFTMNLFIKSSLFQNIFGELTGAISICSLFFLLYVSIENCSFISNLGQFGGVLILSWMSSANNIINITNCIFSKNMATKSNTYLGTDYSQSGNFAGGIYGAKSYMIVTNTIFGESYSPKGSIMGLVSGNLLFENNTYYGNIANEYTDFTTSFFVSMTIINCRFLNETALSHTRSGFIGLYKNSIGYFKNVHFKNMTSPGIYGVLVLGADSSAIIDSCVFENIQTYGSGTLFAIIFNHNYLIKIINNTIINCKCTSYFIMQEESSNVTVWNNSFINNTGNMFDISRGDVDLKFNLVQNIVCHYQSGCLFNLRKSSNMFASNNKFINISNSNEGGAFYFENSNFKSDDLILINSGSDSYAGCLLGVNSHFQIKNFQAYEFKKGCIQFINSSIQIQDSIFQADYFKEPKDFSECYSSLCILECFHFKMNNTLFIGNYDNSYDGGALYITNIKGHKSNFTVYNCSFIGNKAIKRGGGLFIQNASLNILNSTFIKNQAYNGAAIHFINSEKTLSISDCYFLENNANSSGAVFSYDYSPITYSECIFLNNTANYGSISGSYPLKLKFSNSTQKELHSNALQNMSTGTPISLNLEVEICDIDNQKINILNNGFIVVQLINIDSSDEIIYQNIKGRLEAAISNGSAIFNQLIIFAKPLNANLTLAFSSPLINQNLGKIEYNLINNSSNEYIIEKSYYFTIPTTLRQCIPGEIYDEKISSCATCPSNTYSLNPKDYKCNECPLSADCYGGMNLSLHRGYWRSGLYSSIILKCEPYLDSCLGGVYSECKEGYIGALCQVCDNKGSIKYSKQRLYNCVPCADLSSFVIRICFLSIFIIGFYIFIIWYTVKFVRNFNLENRKKNNDFKAFKKKDDLQIGPDEEKLSRALFLKMMINYLQLISLTKQINLDWPGDIPSFLEAQMKLGDASSEILSFDCALFQYSSDIIYVKLVLVFFLPFMATAVLGLFFFLMYLIKLSNVFEYFINSLIITLFLLQPIMINTFFNAVPCTEIDINHFFLTSNLTTVCYNESYYYYIFLICIPGILLWVVLFPLVLLSLLYKKQLNFSNVSFKNKFGFIYIGYHTEKYYWEFMIIYRKILIIISAQLIPIDMKSRALLVLLILAFSLYLQNIHKPFVTKKLNQFEQQSIFLVIITVYLGFFNYLIAEFKFSVFFIVLFFGYNIWFYIYWIYQFWMSQEKKKKLEHFLMRMVNYSHK